MKHRPLTEPQKKVLAFIRAHIEEVGYAPTRSEISVKFGWSSTNSAEQHLRALERSGKVRLAGVARGIVLL